MRFLAMFSIFLFVALIIINISFGYKTSLGKNNRIEKNIQTRDHTMHYVTNLNRKAPEITLVLKNDGHSELKIIYKFDNMTHSGVDKIEKDVQKFYDQAQKQLNIFTNNKIVHQNKIKKNNPRNNNMETNLTNDKHDKNVKQKVKKTLSLLDIQFQSRIYCHDGKKFLYYVYRNRRSGTKYANKKRQESQYILSYSVNLIKFSNILNKNSVKIMKNTDIYLSRDKILIMKKNGKSDIYSIDNVVFEKNLSKEKNKLKSHCLNEIIYNDFERSTLCNVYCELYIILNYFPGIIDLQLIHKEIKNWKIGGDKQTKARFLSDLTVKMERKRHNKKKRCF